MSFRPVERVHGMMEHNMNIIDVQEKIAAMR
jgi:hypothetical protein